MKLVPINDVSLPELDVYARLTNHQLRNVLDPARAVMICETRLVIDVALSCRQEPLSFLVEESKLDSAADLLRRCDDEVPVYVAPKEVMSQLTGFTVTRGLLAAFRRPQPAAVETVLAGARRVAVLESIVDTTNVGAIFRSAAALGADAVLLAPTCADPLSRRALRTSMGCVFRVPWARLEGTWPQDALATLHDQGFTCAALALADDALTLDDPALAAHDRLALFFGTEGDGLTHATLEGCDLTVTIPMAHEVDSLNVAAASAVTFWQLCR